MLLKDVDILLMQAIFNFQLHKLAQTSSEVALSSVV